jgi:hypothetical protein
VDEEATADLEVADLGVLVEVSPGDALKDRVVGHALGDALNHDVEPLVGARRLRW